MRRLNVSVFILSFSLPLVCLSAQTAFACDSPPPPPECSATVVCSLAVENTFLGNDNNVDVQGRIGAAVTLEVTGGDVRCRDQTGSADVDLVATCWDPATGGEVNLLPGSGQFTQVIAQGLNRVDIPFIFEGGVPRLCKVSGSAEVTLSSGQVFQAECKEQNACIGTPSVNDPSKLALNLYIEGDAIGKTPPGAAQTTIYRVENNTSGDLFGALNVAQKNGVGTLQAGDLPLPNPNPDDVCPMIPPGSDFELDCSMADALTVCGCDGTTYGTMCDLEKYGVALLSEGECPEPEIRLSPFSLSHPGGDVMPVRIIEEGEDACIPLPDNPAMAGPTNLEKRLTIKPGITSFRVVRRPWQLCANGSCSVTSLVFFGGGQDAEFYIGCAGGPIIVSDEEPDDSSCNGDGSPPDIIEYELPDLDNDGLSDLFENAHGTNVDNIDSDNDGISDLNEINLGTNPTLADSDNDGLSDSEEIEIHHTNPLVADSDGDLISDQVEIANGTDPNLADTDRDGVSDKIEMDLGTNPLSPDTDGDGLTDQAEIDAGTNPLLADSDNDGVSDGIEIRLGLDPLNAAIPADATIYLDDDNDGLTNSEENALNTNPNLPDTDSDGLFDGVELVYGTNPLIEDTDNDGLKDGEEVYTYFTNPILRDTDTDGLNDFVEITLNTNPRLEDTDKDELIDGKEVEIYKTDPLVADTDKGGVNDGEEIANHYDPLEKSDDIQHLGSRDEQIGLVLEATDPRASTVLFKSSTNIEGLENSRKSTLLQTLSPKLRRISEKVSVDDSVDTAGKTFKVNVNFDAFLNQPDSPFNLSKLEFGIKQRNDEHDGKDLAAIGSVEIETSATTPNARIDFQYVTSAWVVDPGTTLFKRLDMTDFTVDISDKSFELNFTITGPEFKFTNLYIMHDINAFENQAVETACNDNADGDNDGKIDCDDADCSSDPACSDKVVEICGNGIDDDANGMLDCEDPICAVTAECMPNEICDNGTDDDGDGQIDCDDSDCATACDTTVDPDEPGNSNDQDGQVSAGGNDGCGCSSSDPKSPLFLIFALFGLMISRRRKEK